MAGKSRPLFFLYYLKNEFPFHRFAISINKKIDKAVRRNHIKRKMKELFRLNRHLVQENHDLWVVVKKGFDRDNNEKIEKLFLNSLTEINTK